MTSFTNPMSLPANDGVYPKSSHCGATASTPCMCADRVQQCTCGESTAQAGGAATARCNCTACNCA